MDQVASFLYRALAAQDEASLYAIDGQERALLDDFPAPFLAALAPQ
jgi:hypothetical protein